MYRLPLELFILIFSYLEDLFPLLLLDKTINTLITPAAYRRVSLCDEWPVPIHRLPAIRRFLRTLLEKPELANHIQHLKVKYIELPWLGEIPEDLENLAVDAAERGLPAGIQSAVRRGTMASLLFLLLWYATRLKTIDIDPLDSADESLFHQLLHPPFPLGLQSLLSLSVSFSGVPHRKVIAPFLRGLSLTTIRCTNIFLTLDDDDGDEALMNVPGLGLQDIHLEQSEVDGPILRALFTSSRGLRSVTMLNVSMPLPAARTTPAIGPILREFSQDTLHTLELSPETDTPYFLPLGSVRDFPHLRRISCRITTLLGLPSRTAPNSHDLRSLLPRSLVSFSLWVDQAWRDAGCGTSLIQLVEEKQAVVPHLKFLHVGGFMGNPEQKRLGVACDTEYVKLDWSLVPSGLPMPQGLLDGIPLSDFTGLEQLEDAPLV